MTASFSADFDNTLAFHPLTPTCLNIRQVVTINFLGWKWQTVCSWIWTCGSHIKTIGVFYTNTVTIYVLIFIKYYIRYLIQSSWLVSTYPCWKSFGLMDDHHPPLRTAALVQLLFVHSCFLSTYYILYSAESIYSYMLNCTQLLLSLYWKCLPISTVAPSPFTEFSATGRKQWLQLGTYLCEAVELQIAVWFLSANHHDWSRHRISTF